MTKFQLALFALLVISSSANASSLEVRKSAQREKCAHVGVSASTCDELAFGYPGDRDLVNRLNSLDLLRTSLIKSVGEVQKLSLESGILLSIGGFEGGIPDHNIHKPTYSYDYGSFKNGVFSECSIRGDERESDNLCAAAFTYTDSLQTNYGIQNELTKNIIKAFVNDTEAWKLLYKNHAVGNQSVTYIGARSVTSIQVIINGENNYKIKIADTPVLYPNGLTYAYIYEYSYKSESSAEKFKLSFIKTTRSVNRHELIN